MRPAAAAPAPASGYASPTTATSWKAGRFTGTDFPLQLNGALRCPAGSTIHSQERGREADGSLRVVYAASIRQCRLCPLREQCQWNVVTKRSKPRYVSLLLHPLVAGEAPLLWRDWRRRTHWHAYIHLIANQRVEVHLEYGTSPLASSLLVLSRAKRTHTHLSWYERFARNRRRSGTPLVTIKLFSIPHAFACPLGLI